MNLSQKGLDLIKSFEGLVLHAYKAVSTEEYYTIGYGHYGQDVSKTLSITQEQAEELLKQDVKRFVDGVNKVLQVEVNQNQFDSLVSLAYNIGLGAFGRSTLLEKLNKRDFTGTAKEFDRWNKSGGVVLAGLVRRRKEERELFETPVKDEKENQPYYVVVPNLKFWQAKALVSEYQKKGFACEGVSVKKYLPHERPQDKDPYLLYITCNLATAKTLVIELKHKGYGMTFGRSR